MGSGKALLWMLPAATFWAHKSCIVVVPLIALQADFIWQCENEGIQCSVWSTSRPNLHTLIIFVSAEDGVTADFIGFLKRLAYTDRLAHIFIEEVHLLISAQSYHPNLPYLCNLYSVGVAVTLLSATLPPHIMPSL
jgi:superfamily II DNA helicase RecQ